VTRWHRYETPAELLADLDLTDEELDRARERTDTFIRAWHLTQVRKAQDRTQSDLAQAMGVTQPRVSEIESGELDRVTLSTLRAYVRALGGTVRIVADFGDRTYRLS
jgi:predicted XRE-type DNA-binding protein